MSIKVNCRFNELDIEGQGVDAAEFFNRSSDIIRVIYLAAVRDESYRYDGVGNRISETIDQGAGETKTSIYDNHKDLLMHNGTTGFVYDILGNLIEKGSDYRYDSASNTTTVNPTTADYRRYTYDLFGRMTQVRGLGGENTVVLLAEYVYDFRGMRIAKRKGAQIIRCDLDESGRNLEIEDSQGVQTTAWIGQKPLAMQDSGGTYCYISDHQGTTAMMTDRNGAVLWEDATNPFGIQAGSRGTMQSGVLFTGKVFDPDADMYYFNARWYNPETGRFASEDPARDGINWYAYVDNNPLKYTDPTGLRRTREERQAERAARREARQQARRERQEEREQKRIESANEIRGQGNTQKADRIVSRVRNRARLRDKKRLANRIDNYTKAKDSPLFNGLKNHLVNNLDEWGSFTWENQGVSPGDMLGVKGDTFEVLTSDTIAGRRMRKLMKSSRNIGISVGRNPTNRTLATNAIRSGLFIGSDVTITLNPYKIGYFSDGSPRYFRATIAHEFAHEQRMAASTNPWFRYFREIDGMLADNEYRFKNGIEQRDEYGKWNVPKYDLTTDKLILAQRYLIQSLFGHASHIKDAR